MTHKDYQAMTTEELEKLADQFVQEENAVMRELLRRGWGRNLPNDLEHADMQRTEEDF